MTSQYGLFAGVQLKQSDCDDNVVGMDIEPILVKRRVVDLPDFEYGFGSARKRRKISNNQSGNLHDFRKVHFREDKNQTVTYEIGSPPCEFKTGQNVGNSDFRPHLLNQFNQGDTTIDIVDRDERPGSFQFCAPLIPSTFLARKKRRMYAQLRKQKEKLYRRKRQW